MHEEQEAVSLLNAKLNEVLGEYINTGRPNKIGYKVFVNEGFKSDYTGLFKEIEVYNLINNLITWRYDIKGEEIEQLQSIDRILVLINEELEND